MSVRYRNSEAWLARALNTIPLGSQTFSKSITQFPHGASPYFLERGQGSRVWDADGNEYIDYVNGLGAVLLGYCDPDVDEAVSRQMKNGVSFSLAHRLEMELAELLTAFIPCAEMVRFGKNGSDATAGAIRLARAYTSREHVAVCGYHGWQDWYIGSTARHLGVPQAVRDLTHPFVYNRLDTLERLFADYPGQLAAVILEPMNTTAPAPGFLEGVQELCRKHGTVLIFDETITGFRFDLGGAQKKFGITPDLATFGKGMGNGYPISAIVGRRDLMMLMEDIFFSFTFGGETLSLAAASATIRKLASAPVLDAIHRTGRRIMDGMRDAIIAHQLDEALTVSGSPPWSFLGMADCGDCSAWTIKTFYLQEMLARGILTLGTQNMSYAHSDEDVSRFLLAFDETLEQLSAALQAGDVEGRLQCTPLVPLFKVR